MAFKQKTTSTTVHALEIVKHYFESRIFPYFQFVHVKMSDLIKGKITTRQGHFDNFVKNSLEIKIVSIAKRSPKQHENSEKLFVSAYTNPKIVLSYVQAILLSRTIEN